MRLDVKAFALTCGIFWGLSIFVVTWWLILVHGTYGPRTFLGWFYLGYNVSATGSIIGLIWGFLDGLICGAVFSWLYNLLRGKKEE